MVSAILNMEQRRLVTFLKFPLLTVIVGKELLIAMYHSRERWIERIPMFHIEQKLKRHELVRTIGILVA